MEGRAQRLARRRRRPTSCMRKTAVCYAG